MPNWAKLASAPCTRRISDQDRAIRQLSLRRVTCKAHPHPHLLPLQLLAEIFYCAIPDSYGNTASDTLVLCLERNASIPHAVENRVMYAFDDEGELQHDKYSEIWAELLKLAEESLPSIDQFFVTATRIRVSTEEARPGVSYSFSEENELIFPFSEVPRMITSLRPPLVQIASLKRLGPAGWYGLSAGVDRVLWDGHDGVFAFKRADRDFDTTAHEIELLLRDLSHNDLAPYSLAIEGVVVDLRGRLRGYLSAFNPYGSIEEVFLNRKYSQLTPDILSDVGAIAFPYQPEWVDKLRWASQLARGIATVHDIHSTHGPLTLCNLNPRNVLVSGTASASNSKSTSLIIAGFGGAGSSTGMRYPRRWPAPERWRQSTYEIGLELDVANLGMVLWALAEEKFDGFPDIYSEKRRDISAGITSRRGGPVVQGRSDLWRKNNPPTPGWYRLLVEECVEEEPARRPRAKEVAGILERHL